MHIHGKNIHGQVTRGSTRFQFHNVLPLLSHIQCQTSHPKTTEQILHLPQPIWKPPILLLVFCKTSGCSLQPNLLKGRQPNKSNIWAPWFCEHIEPSPLESLSDFLKSLSPHWPKALCHTVTVFTRLPTTELGMKVSQHRGYLNIPPWWLQFLLHWVQSSDQVPVPATTDPVEALQSQCWNTLFSYHLAAVREVLGQPGTSLTFNPLYRKATVTEQEIQRRYLGVKQPHTEQKNAVLKGMCQSSSSTGISPSCSENELQTPNENSHIWEVTLDACAGVYFFQFGREFTQTAQK